MLKQSKEYTKEERLALEWSRQQKLEKDRVERAFKFRQEDKVRTRRDSRSRSRSRSERRQNDSDLDSRDRKKKHKKHKKEKSGKKDRRRDRSNSSDSREINRRSERRCRNEEHNKQEEIFARSSEGREGEKKKVWDGFGDLYAPYRGNIENEARSSLQEVSVPRRSRSRSPLRRDVSRSPSRSRARIRSRSRTPESRKKKWGHDMFSDTRDKSPPSRIPSDYRPPSPTWVSRAGGVAIMRKKLSD